MLGKHIVRQFLTQILGLIVGFVISIITTRILGVEGRGDFALILNTSGFLNLILGFSLSSAIIHFVSTDKAALRDTVNTLTLIISILAILCLLMLLFFPFQKFDFLLPSSLHQHFNGLIILILFLITLCSTLFSSILSGRKLFHLQQKSYFVIAPVSLVAYLVLFYFKDRLTIDFSLFIIFYLIISIVPSLVNYIIYLKNVRPTFSFTFLSKIQLKYLLNFSFFSYIANLLQFLSYRMDFWFVQFYMGSRQLGIYSLSVNLAQMLWLLPQAVSTILISYSGQRDEQVAINQTNILSRISLNIIIAVTIFLEITIGYIIPLLYGKEFEDSVLIFQLLLIGIMPFSVTTILASYFAGKGNIKINLYCSTIGFAVCLLLDFMLIPKFGITGAAIATVFSYLISTLFIIIVYLQKTKSTVSQLLIMTKEDFLMLKNKINSKFLFLEKR